MKNLQREGYEEQMEELDKLKDNMQGLVEKFPKNIEFL